MDRVYIDAGTEEAPVWVQPGHPAYSLELIHRWGVALTASVQCRIRVMVHADYSLQHPVAHAGQIEMQ